MGVVRRGLGLTLPLMKSPWRNIVPKLCSVSLKKFPRSRKTDIVKNVDDRLLVTV